MIAEEGRALRKQIAEAFPTDARASVSDYVSGQGYIDYELMEALKARCLAVDGTLIRYFYNDLPAFTRFGWHQVIGAWLLYAIEHPEGDECQYLVYDLRRRVNDTELIDSLNDEQRGALVAFARNIIHIDDPQLPEMLREIIDSLSR